MFNDSLVFGAQDSIFTSEETQLFAKLTPKNLSPGLSPWSPQSSVSGETESEDASSHHEHVAAEEMFTPSLWFAQTPSLAPSAPSLHSQQQQSLTGWTRPLQHSLSQPSASLFGESPPMGLSLSSEQTPFPPAAPSAMRIPALQQTHSSYMPNQRSHQTAQAHMHMPNHAAYPPQHRAPPAHPHSFTHGNNNGMRHQPRHQPVSYSHAQAHSAHALPMSMSSATSSALGAAQGRIYQVQFKCRSRYFTLSPQTSATPLSVGDFVVVEADRGEDIGVVTEILPMKTFVERRIYSGKAAAPSDEDEHIIGRILRLAAPSERQLLPEKYRDEESVLQLCRELCYGTYRLPMHILDVDYQFDRHKLTIYYSSDARIDFREFVRDLFSAYKARIWMKKVNPNKPVRVEEWAVMSLATGMQCSQAMR